MNPIYYHVFVDPGKFVPSDFDVILLTIFFGVIFVGGGIVTLIDWFKNRK